MKVKIGEKWTDCEGDQCDILAIHMDFVVYWDHGVKCGSTIPCDKADDRFVTKTHEANGDPVCEYCIPYDEERQCRDVNGMWRCSREKGHDGDHVACCASEHRHEIDRWTQWTQCPHCVPQKERCHETEPDGTLICWRKKGHGGEHVACASPDHDIKRWPQEEPAAKPGEVRHEIDWSDDDDGSGHYGNTRTGVEIAMRKTNFIAYEFEDGYREMTPHTITNGDGKHWRYWAPDNTLGLISVRATHVIMKKEDS